MEVQAAKQGNGIEPELGGVRQRAEPGAAADGRRHLGFWEFVARRDGGRC